MDNIKPLEWANDTTLGKVKEIVRLAELQLEDAREFGTAGDARASVIGTGMATIAAGFVAASAALFGLENHDLAACSATSLAALFFIIAAALAVAAAKPVKFYARGYDPKNLTNVEASRLQLAKWVAENSSYKLERNLLSLKRSASMLRLSYYLAAAGIIMPLILLVGAEVKYPLSALKPVARVSPDRLLPAHH